jgi:hypothetical protein
MFSFYQLVEDVWYSKLPEKVKKQPEAQKRKEQWGRNMQRAATARNDYRITKNPKYKELEKQHFYRAQRVKNQLSTTGSR